MANHYLLFKLLLSKIKILANGEDNLLNFNILEMRFEFLTLTQYPVFYCIIFG